MYMEGESMTGEPAGDRSLELSLEHIMSHVFF